MINWIIGLITALVLGFLGLFFIVESDTTAEPPEPDTIVVNLAGTVTGTIDDCAFDGICAFIIDDKTEVIWANGMMQCLGSMDNDITIGDQVEVYAEVPLNTTRGSQVTICTGEEYYIRKS